MRSLALRLLVVACLSLSHMACSSGDEATATDSAADAPATAMAEQGQVDGDDRPSDPKSEDPSSIEDHERSSSYDLASFHGEYGPSDDPESSRTWWVTTEPCEKRGLRVGAMWGDASPWNLEPEPGRVFVGTTFSGKTIRAEFGPEGETPRALRLEVGDDARELVRVGNLPEGFRVQCRRG